MFGGGHKYDALLFVDVIKEAPVANSVAPSRRVPIFQSLNVHTGMRNSAKNRVDVLTKFGFQAPR